MNYTIETTQHLRARDIDTVAQLTALGFGREADEHNLQDTIDHLETADCIQVTRTNEQLVAFAAYRRLLWRTCS